MEIDTEQFPLVWLRGTHDAAAPRLADFDALLARGQPFVLINDDGLADGRPGRRPPGMTRLARWMARHQGALRRVVKAAICVEPCVHRRVATESFAIVHEWNWGYPMLMVSAEEEAVDLAAHLLSAGA